MGEEKIWIPLIRRCGESVLMTSYLMTAYQDQYHQEILLLPRGIRDTKYLDGLVIGQATDLGAFEQILAEHLSPEYIAYFISRCRYEADRLLRTAREIRSKTPYDTMTETELTLLFTTYSSDTIRVMPFLFGLVTLERVLQSDLETKLENHCKEHKVKEDPKIHLGSLIFPEEKNIPSLALVELYELASQVNANPPLRKLFDQEPGKSLPQIGAKFPEFMREFDVYLDKYDFMNMEYYAGRPVTPYELFERIKDVIGDAKERLARIEQNRKKTEVVFQQASDKLKLTSELRSFIETVKTIHYLRQHRADALYKAGRDVFEFIATMGEQLGINYDGAISLTWQELSESLVLGQLTVSPETIAARQADYGILLVDGELSFITDDELAKELAMLPVAKEEKKELHGDIAFRGKYRGRVVIVTAPEEIGKVQQGDVLVSPMTDPYYVPAMVRAGAIVTDEGGILSHAAIVSRELGVPCVIGTHVATTVLSDGMIIEVDATRDTGIIRIVEE
jgi:phosphohistidine swiveling domain-containing protein